MYLEWFVTSHATAQHDVASLRAALPSANLVRFVGVLWKDSIKESDGLECSTDDASQGYLDATCLQYMDELIAKATDAGLFLILSARAKYAAGWSWPDEPDVFHDSELRRRYLAMWAFLVARYASWDRVVGFEIMSEPRSKVVSQRDVTEFMAAGCAVVRAHDARALCVVGPAPYYKVWELTEAILLPIPNVLYTFDFFLPWKFVSSDSAKSAATFPATFPCQDVYDTWWRGHCASAAEKVVVDAAWINATIERIPAALRLARSVPVYCNQWGVKAEVYESRGRFAYARALLDALMYHNIPSTYWLWRSMEKAGRATDEPVWGFELVRNNGVDPEALDAPMVALLEGRFRVGAGYLQPRATNVTESRALRNRRR